MLKFPEIKPAPEPPRRKMTLEEYNRFCDFCRQNNPKVTPENCMKIRQDEARMKEPFRFRNGPDQKSGGANE